MSFNMPYFPSASRVKDPAARVWMDGMAKSLDNYFKGLNERTSGRIMTNMKTVTSAFTATADEATILANGTFTVTLPTAVGIRGKTYTVKNIGTGVITVEPDGSETIDTCANFVLSQHETIRIQSDNANWWIL